MNLIATKLDFSDDSDKSIAKALFNLFLYQYNEATRDEMELRSRFHAMEVANDTYIRESNFDGSFGRSPFTPQELTNAKNLWIEAQNNSSQSKRVMQFLVDKFLTVDLTAK